MQWIPGLLSPPPLEGLGTRLILRLIRLGTCCLGICHLGNYVE